MAGQYRGPTFLEHLYGRQCQLHSGIKTKSLPHALAILTDKRVVSFENAKIILEQHADELVKTDLKNPFAHLHEKLTRSRRKKKFDELMGQYSIHMALQSK
ncbi:hypothetical protein HYV43_03060 [Candidatus Micrarchaeota archaeon]|nr:hypothetical protein [Candidatus Micrarchaeota archaeon]